MANRLMDTLKYALKSTRTSEKVPTVLWNMNGTVFQISSDSKPRWS
ncbi:MAG: hypothetical protein K6T83_09175 [Alicyclobacillus sp.]|nr:hypothetical protein [Alicyclobacillus sp.]